LGICEASIRETGDATIGISPNRALNAGDTLPTPLFSDGGLEHPHSQFEIVLVRVELGILVHSPNQFLQKAGTLLA